MKYTNKLTGIVKGGAAAAVVLYPATKLVWATDSAAKNYLPVGMPGYARTPLVTLALGALAAALPAGYWTEKAGEMILAGGLVQTLQQYGQTVPGQPGTIDTAVNKLFQPLANVGMKGYTERLRGYIVKRQGLSGYLPTAPTNRAAGMGTTRPLNTGPIHPNDQLRGRGTLRGFQTEHVLEGQA